MKDIADSLKNKLIKDGAQDVNNLFKKTTESELKVITDLYKTYSNSALCNIYSDDDLDTLKNYNVPSKIVEFYKEHSSVNSVDIGADVYLLSLDNIRSENSELAPGAFLIKCGVMTFASTTGDNDICMDLNDINDGEPRIIIADHSVFTDKQIILFKDTGMEEHVVTYEIIKKYAPEVSKTFTKFLNMVINGEVDDIEEYLD